MYILWGGGVWLISLSINDFEIQLCCFEYQYLLPFLFLNSILLYGYIKICLSFQKGYNNNSNFPGFKVLEQRGSCQHKLHKCIWLLPSVTHTVISNTLPLSSLSISGCLQRVLCISSSTFAFLLSISYNSTRHS